MPRFLIKRYAIYDVNPGMQLSRDVLINDKVALSEGTRLNSGLIERLKLWGITTLDIREETIDGEFGITGKSVDTVQQKFFDSYDRTINVIKSAFETMRFFNEVPLQEMRELAFSAITPLSQSIGVINHLHMVHRQDDYTFHHSVNVAVICGVLGRWLGYKGNELNELILAGLLHDIGKTKIPLEILNKPGKLSVDEMNIMKLHTIYGYKLITTLPSISRKVHFGVLQHHERLDGSGYPLRVTADKIHPYARVVAVADLYDALTSDRVYRKKLTPFAVVEMMVEEMFNKLDPQVCTVFLNNVRDYLNGNVVELNDGREAEVMYLGHFAAARPVVRTYDGEFIDLEKQKNICIVRLVKA